jgi:SAM-dependent methyltransferase
MTVHRAAAAGFQAGAETYERGRPSYPDEAVDLIVEVLGAAPGRAFHWFDGDRALEELARVLHPGGALVLVWNVRDTSVPWVAATSDVVDRYRGDVPSHYAGRWRDAFGRSERFTLLEERAVPYGQVLDEDGFVDRFMSVSVLASLDGAERAKVEADLRGIVAGFEQPFVLPHHTRVHWCRRR